MLKGEALPQLLDSMDQDPEPIAVIPGLEDPIHLGPTRWDPAHQWQDQEDQEGLEVRLDQVGLVGTWGQVGQGVQWEVRWDQVDQWDKVVLVDLVQEDKDLATE